jgi:hypothetical protein
VAQLAQTALVEEELVTYRLLEVVEVVVTVEVPQPPLLEVQVQMVEQEETVVTVHVRLVKVLAVQVMLMEEEEEEEVILAVQPAVQVVLQEVEEVV